MFNVQYRIRGYAEERVAGPYESAELALTHADDIRGYEGVEYAVVVPIVSPPNAPERGETDAQSLRQR